MRKNIHYVLLSLLFTFVLILSACGKSATTAAPTAGASAEPAANAPAQSASPVEQATAQDPAQTQKITVWAWDDAFNVAIMQEAYDEYISLNPDSGIEIEIVSSSKEDTYKKLQTGLAAGGKNLPDICLIEDYSIFQYLNAYSKYFYPLEGQLDYSQFSPFKVGVMTYKDQAYGVPFDTGVTATFYRSDYLTEAGYSAADLTGITWDKFIEIGKAVEAKTGKKMTVANGTNYSSMFRLMMQSAGAWYCDSEGNLNITNNEVLKEALETIKKMRDAGVILECADDSTLAGAINDGSTASVINAAWRVSTIKAEPEQSGKWAIAPIPKLNNLKAVNASNTGGSSWYVLDNGQPKEKIVEFLNAMYGGNLDFYNKILINQGALCAYLPAMTGEAFETADEFFGGQKIYADLAALLPQIPAVTYGNFVPEANTAVNSALFNYLQGSIAVEEALQQAEDQLKNQIQQ